MEMQLMKAGVAKPKHALPQYKWDNEEILANGVIRKRLEIRKGMVLRYPGMVGFAWRRDLGKVLTVDFYPDGRKIVR